MWLKAKDLLVNLDRMATVQVRRSLTGDEEFAIDAYYSEDSNRLTLFEVSGPGAREEVAEVYERICNALAEERRYLDITTRVVTPGV